MELVNHRTHSGFLMTAFSAHIRFLGNHVCVPKDKSVHFLITNPALFVSVFDQLPLTTARHIHLVAQYSCENHSAVSGIIICKLIHKTIDALSLHILLDLDCLSCYWLFSILLFACRELAN